MRRCPVGVLTGICLVSSDVEHLSYVCWPFAHWFLEFVTVYKVNFIETQICRMVFYCKISVQQLNLFRMTFRINFYNHVKISELCKTLLMHFM